MTRKEIFPLHSVSMVNEMFHHDGQHKVSTASSLLHRALNLPNSSEGKKRKLNYIHAALESNGSSIEVHQKHTGQQQQNASPGELVGIFFKMVEPTESRESFASLPYIKGAFDTCPQKIPCHSCKRTIYHSTTTVSSSEIPTFDGIADQLRV